jgi:hypothetical protein
MGKNSLIKSTEKKKAKSTPKTAAPKKKAAGKTATSQKAAASKTNAKKSAKKAPPANKKAKLSVKDLILKKFESLPGQPKPQPALAPVEDLPPAPPFIASDDPDEIKRIRKLLQVRFSMEDIRSAASRKAAEDTQIKEDKPPALPSEPVSEEPEVVEEDAAPTADSAQSSYVPPAFDNDGSDPDPVKRAFKFAAVGFAVIILLLVGASLKNSSKYYIETKADAIEIWRGRFSPTGKERVVLLHGISAPQDADTVYTRNHVYPLAFNYYLDKADALLDVPGPPDYEAIKAYLFKADPFAINEEMKDNIRSRLNGIELVTLFYKIDVAIRQGTKDSLKQAAQMTRAAGRLTANATQSQLIAQKAAEITALQEALAASEAQKETQQAQESGEPQKTE